MKKTIKANSQREAFTEGYKIAPKGALIESVETIIPPREGRQGLFSIKFDSGMFKVRRKK